MTGLSVALTPASRERTTRVPWRVRVFDAISTYLPLLLMGLLALGTWWLVKNTPVLEAARADLPPTSEPDYEMNNFVIQRFAADGAIQIRVEGRRMHHYPLTDTLEIDGVRIHAVGRDGGVITASADRALANADASEVQLLGKAHVVRHPQGSDAQTEFHSEFLHFFQATERVRSHLPVTVRRGSSEFRADAVEYDNLAQVIELRGKVHAVFAPNSDAVRTTLP
jgi:lipopolysaccharide export system protein LptC